MFSLTPMVRRILTINVGVHLVVFFLSGIGEALKDLGSVYYLFSGNFYIFQYATYMWLHHGWLHLLFNMIGLVVFGPMLESVWGYKRFLVFYLVVGIGAGLFYGAADVISKRVIESDTDAYVVNPNSDDFYNFIFKHESRLNRAYMPYVEDFSEAFEKNPDSQEYKDRSVEIVYDIHDRLTKSSRMLGASGAIMGILLAFGMLFPNTELMLLFPPIPIKAKYLVFFYGAYQLYHVINPREGDNVSYITHIGGLIMAFVVLKFWQKKRGTFY